MQLAQHSCCDEDPDRSPKDLARRRRGWSRGVAETPSLLWADRIYDYLCKFGPCTFNCICVEMLGQPAAELVNTRFAEGLWLLLTMDRVGYSRSEPIVFGVLDG